MVELKHYWPKHNLEVDHLLRISLCLRHSLGPNDVRGGTKAYPVVRPSVDPMPINTHSQRRCLHQSSLRPNKYGSDGLLLSLTIQEGAMVGVQSQIH